MPASNTSQPRKKLLSVADCQSLNIDEVHSLYRQHVNSSKVDLLSIFDFGNELVDKAQGLYIHTKSGRVVYDFTGGIGVLNHGHNHPRILKVRQDFQNQHRMEVHKNFFSQYVAALSHNLSILLPGDLDHSFFPNSGSEAVDGALKTAFKYHDGKRKHFLYSNIAFHGKLFGASSVTNSPENHYAYPKLANTHQFEFNNIDSVKQAIDKLRDKNGACTVCGLILEPFNVSNLRQCSAEFLLAVRELCSKEDIVLIFDEIYSGWCKSGELFYFMKIPGLLPDVLCMAKSFGGGKSSIAGMVTRKKIFKKAFDTPKSANMQTSTFYSFGEETVTALEAVNIIIEEDFVIKSQRIEKKLSSGCQKLKNKYPQIITDARGAGAIHGIFINPGPEILGKLVNFIPGEIFDDERFMAKLVTTAVISHLYTHHNILTFTSLGYEIHLIVAPPLVVTDDEIDHFFACLDKTFAEGLLSLVIKFAKKKFFK